MSHHTNRRRHTGSGGRGSFGQSSYHHHGGNGHHSHHQGGTSSGGPPQHTGGGPREQADVRLCKFFLVGGLKQCQSGQNCKYAHVLQRVADLEAGGRDAGINNGRAGPVKAVAAWASSPGGGVKLFTGSKDGAVRMWDALTWKLENSEQLEGEVHCLSVKSNVLACGYEGETPSLPGARVGLCRVFDLAGGRVFNLAVRTPGAAAGVGVPGATPGGGPGAASGNPGAAGSSSVGDGFAHAARVYCVAIRDSAGDGGAVSSASTSGGAVEVYTGGHEGEIHGWRLASDATEFRLVVRVDAALAGGHVAGVTCLALFAQSRFLVSGSMDRTVRVWNLAAADASASAAAVPSAVSNPQQGADVLPLSCECVRTAHQQGHTDVVTAAVELVLGDDQLFFVSAGLDACFKVWDARGELAFDKQGLPAPVMALATAADALASGGTGAPLLLVGLQDGTIEIRQPTTQFKLRATLNAAVTQGHRGEVRAIATGDQYFCSAGSDGRLMVWQWVAPLPPPPPM